jgi:hypothetical protein
VTHESFLHKAAPEKLFGRPDDETPPSHKFRPRAELLQAVDSLDL